MFVSGRASSAISRANHSKKLPSRNFSSSLSFKKFGSPSEVLSVQSETVGSVTAGTVKVKLLATSVHGLDLERVRGRVTSVKPGVAGMEGVGVVQEVGQGVSDLAVNDRVVIANPTVGAWRTEGVFNSRDLFKIDQKLKTEYAAALTVSPVTALRLLEDFVTLREGDVVIQNISNGMVGQCVVQMCAARGVKTINIIRERSDQASIIERMKSWGGYIVVPANYTKTLDFRKLIGDLPAPRLALNGAGGATATEMVRVLAPGGTMVTYAGNPLQIPSSTLISKDLRLRGFSLSRWLAEHSVEERNAALTTVSNMIVNPRGDAVTDSLRFWLETHKFEHWKTAIDRTENGHSSRKIILTL